MLHLVAEVNLRQVLARQDGQDRNCGRHQQAGQSGKAPCEQCIQAGKNVHVAPGLCCCSCESDPVCPLEWSSSIPM